MAHCTIEEVESDYLTMSVDELPRDRLFMSRIWHRQARAELDKVETGQVKPDDYKSIILAMMLLMSPPLLVNRYNHRSGFPRSKEEHRDMTDDLAASSYLKIKSDYLVLNHQDDEASDIVIQASDLMHRLASERDWGVNTILLQADSWAREEIKRYEKAQQEQEQSHQQSDTLVPAMSALTV